ncbi:unnamed protein product [Moneuplotes crassus]|uniref:Uncharacterized protein n=1 Tax=Euplotes crassus TaxID=5936 RepID=A0AAD1X4U6_EUPCR|nr:unnamed protein product [Moneuplotes crassus]
MVPGESLKRILEFHCEDQYYDPSSESEDELEIENDRLVKAAKDFISRVETSQDQYKIHELNQGPSQNQISCEIGFDDSFGVKNGLEEDFNDKQDHFKKFSLGQNIQRNNLDAVQGSHLRNKASLYQEGKSLSYIPTETSAIEKMNNSGDSEEIGNMLCSLEC